MLQVTTDDGRRTVANANIPLCVCGLADGWVSEYSHYTQVVPGNQPTIYAASIYTRISMEDTLSAP